MTKALPDGDVVHGAAMIVLDAATAVVLGPLGALSGGAIADVAVTEVTVL